MIYKILLNCNIYFFKKQKKANFFLKLTFLISLYINYLNLIFFVQKLKLDLLNILLQLIKQQRK